ncbi:hypothetical protein SSU05_0387 [Streptococcus suis 05ZYH33]|nr:hypothetical protein SSU05_0387 [Streptococcus suis 05ZYH33]
MIHLLNKIKLFQGLYSGTPAIDQKLAVAEINLHLIFPPNYKDYLKNYGVISFYGTKWNGLKGNTWTDVFATTLEALILYKNFPIREIYFQRIYILMICLF